jgi:predicted adenylyl cyclase CyaB
MIEIEKRYKIHDVPAIIQRLAENAIHLVNQTRVIDEWFTPLRIQNQEQEEEWFDKDHGVAYRIRRTQMESGEFVVKVESKQLTDANNHDTFKEETLDITDYDAAHRYLEEMEYWNWLTIDKTRRTFASPDPEIQIVLDEIAGLAEKIGVGAALELEYEGSATRDEALAKLVAFSEGLGLSSDQLFDKSLTVEAMSELAKFDTTN